MRLYFLLCLLFFSNSALSGVIPEKSRIVFNGKNTVQSYVLVNANKYPVVVQLWVDNGEFNQMPELTPSPFIITPVILKMEPLKLNSIKIIYSDNNFNLPDDYESLFWLNILEIPPINRDNINENEVSLSMLTQIKILYRPKKLEINQNELIEKLDKLSFKFSKTKKGLWSLTIANPTEYIASLSQITLLGKENNKLVPFKPHQLSNLTLLPKSTQSFELTLPSNLTEIERIEYWLIDDQGKFIPKQKKLTNS